MDSYAVNPLLATQKHNLVTTLIRYYDAYNFFDDIFYIGLTNPINKAISPISATSRYSHTENLGMLSRYTAPRFQPGKHAFLGYL